MDKLGQLALFTRIVDAGSFVRAARELNIARSTATESIKILESEVGAQLLARTTRHVTTTVDGEEFYRHARAILDEVEDAFGAFRAGKPRGHLRIDASGLLTRTFITPHLPEFLSQFPDITIQLGQSDRLVDLVREGVDCALRVGIPEDSNLRMRRLGVLPELTCASPAYIKQYGVPQDIDNLAGHVMVGFVSSRSGEVMPLEFMRDGRNEIRRLPARVTTDNSDTAAELARQGFGLIQAPHYRLKPMIEQGLLVEVLADTLPEPMQLNALYAGERRLSRRLDVFLDWVIKIFASYSDIALHSPKDDRR